MPCTFTGSLHGDEILFTRNALDDRERMLCAVCRELERNFGKEETAKLLFRAEMNAKGIRGGQIQKWWIAHKAADEAKERGQ